jgi:hypothetical protein
MIVSFVLDDNRDNIALLTGAVVMFVTANRGLSVVSAERKRRVFESPSQ